MERWVVQFRVTEEKKVDEKTRIEAAAEAKKWRLAGISGLALFGLGGAIVLGFHSWIGFAPGAIGVTMFTRGMKRAHGPQSWGRAETLLKATRETIENFVASVTADVKRDHPDREFSEDELQQIQLECEKLSRVMDKVVGEATENIQILMPEKVVINRSGVAVPVHIREV
jgi:hypothetical protein